MRSINRKQLATAALLALLAALALQLDQWRRPPLPGQDLAAPGQPPTLKVLTRNLSTAYYLDDDRPAGPEYELVTAFAEFIGATPQLMVKDSIGELLQALRDGDGHLVAAAITRTEARADQLAFGPAYQTIQQLVVCHRDAVRPAAAADLVGRQLRIIADSSYAETLSAWRERHPDLAWETTAELSTEQILEAVAEGTVDCTLADSNIVAVNHRYLPELAVAFAASETQPLAWVLRDAQGTVARQLEAWMARPETAELIATVLHRYYGHIDRFDYVDNRTYRQRIGDRLPQFRQLFEVIAGNHDLPWTLIAAQAYQESHWDPGAESPTGVRGLMMLTRRTAESLGVDDRLDPAQSIYGGARYLRRLLTRLPDSVDAADRLWFALAAYNIGMGHLLDARALASRLGRDPDRWYDIERTLPLLTQQRYYRHLKYGYARGKEAVRYVQRVRNYQAVLQQALAGAEAATPAL